MKDCRNFLTLSGPDETIQKFDNRFYHSDNMAEGYSVANILSGMTIDDPDLLKLLRQVKRSWEYKDDIHMTGVYQTFDSEKKMAYEFYTKDIPALDAIIRIAPEFPELTFYYSYRRGNDKKHTLHIISGSKHYSSDDFQKSGDILRFLVDNPKKIAMVCKSCNTVDFYSARLKNFCSCIKCMKKVG